MSRWIWHCGVKGCKGHGHKPVAKHSAKRHFHQHIRCEHRLNPLDYEGIYKKVSKDESIYDNLKRL